MSISKPIVRLAVPSLLLAASAASQAVIWSLSASLDGLQEVPPNASPATGTFTGTYDTVTNTLNYTLSVSGLLGTTTAAHVHGPAGPGVNAGVLIPLIIPTGVTSFTTSNSVVAGTETFEGLLAVGQINAYVNVHTGQFPGGEVRGQLNAVPEPATLAILAPAALLALRKRRR